MHAWRNDIKILKYNHSFFVETDKGKEMLDLKAKEAARNAKKETNAKSIR